MAGPAFYFQVLEQATAALAGGSAADKDRAQLLNDHAAFAHLGALGPDLLRYVPVDPALLDRIDAAGVLGLGTDDQLEVVRHPLMVAYGMLYRKIVLDLWPFLAQLLAFYDHLDAAAAAENADQLAALDGELNAIQAGASTITDLASRLNKLRDDVAGPVIVAARPVIQTDYPLAVKQWRGFEFLRWLRTGRFARTLLELAGQADQATRDPLTAYAYGYLCHVAAATTGEPFVDNIVGGPYRTHWWRNRYVGNYVDAWTYGRYVTPGGVTMSGDDPTPAYDDPAWARLCSANLQNAIAFASPAPAGMDAARAVSAGPLPAPGLPDGLAELLVASVQATYDFGLDLTPDELKDEQTYHRAYTGLYSVLWLMTSGEGPLCLGTLGPPPASCTDEPSWVSSGGSPPSPVESSGGDTGSSVALAILALLLLLGGNWPGGLAAIAGAIAAAKDHKSIDWAQLRCNLYWQRHHLFEIEQGIRDLLIIAGLAYPQPHQLGMVGDDGHTVPSDGINKSGRPLTRTIRADRYPMAMDDSVNGAPDLNYLNFPVAGVEQKGTLDLQDDHVYADHVVSGMGVQNGGMLTDGTYPTRGVSFGGAVANAVEVIRKDAADLADYDLDGDRGYGWLSWRPKLGTKPKDGGVVDEQVN